MGALGGGSPKAMGGQDPDLWPEGPHRLGVDSASTGGMEDGPPDSGALQLARDKPLPSGGGEHPAHPERRLLARRATWRTLSGRGNGPGAERVMPSGRPWHVAPPARARQLLPARPANTPAPVHALSPTRRVLGSRRAAGPGPLATPSVSDSGLRLSPRGARRAGL